ncbi:MAG: trigger factor [Opitutales bacterium]|nr:trigger factor [Opitutales bacterium]
MKTTIEEITPSRKNLILTLSEEEINEARGGIVKEVAKTAQMPGFRPGRAPLDLIEKKFRRQIKDELNRKLLNSKLQEAIKEEKLSVLGIVDVKQPESFDEGGEQTVTYTLDLNPEFETPDYLGIELEPLKVEVTDEEVTQQIDEMRKQRAEFNVVERAAETGDYVQVTYSGKIEDKPIAEILPDRPIYGDQTSTWEEAGNSEFGVPGLPEALVGMKAGEEKEIEVAFPDDFKESELAGKKATYKVEVKEVRERKMPEINEEFLKGLQVESEEALKEKMKQDLLNRKQQEEHFKRRQKLADDLADKVEFAVPESPIEARTEQYLRRLVEQNTQQGVPREKLEEKKEELAESARQTAFKRVKLEYIIFQIAEKEKIELTQDDMQRVLINEAMRSGKKPQDLVKEWQKDQDQLRHIQREVLFDKTLDTLVDRVLKKDQKGEETPEETAETKSS